MSYYTYITRAYYALRKNYAYPDILISSVRFQRIIDADYETPEIIRSAICGLAKAGADFVVASCNSIHTVYDEVVGDIPIPWVSIMDATAEAIRAAGLTRVGLMGTSVTMEKGFYQAALARHGLATITPAAEVRARINKIIFGELIRDEICSESRALLLRGVKDLKADGAEGVILGCTELPFGVKQEDTDVPLFDTTRIHAQKTLELAMQP